MLWVQRMDGIEARAEEIVREEIIYCLWQKVARTKQFLLFFTIYADLTLGKEHYVFMIV